MSKTQKAIDFLNSVSNDLHNLNTTFNQNIINEVQNNFINIIKQNISNAADVIDTVQSSNGDQIIMLESIVNECTSSLHNILKDELITQHTEDLYADLSANIYCIHEQVERIKNS